MAKKKKKFKDIWCNQTKLSEIYGVSAVKIGKMLKDAGLKGKDCYPTGQLIPRQTWYLVSSKFH